MVPKILIAQRKKLRFLSEKDVIRERSGEFRGKPWTYSNSRMPSIG